VNVRALIIDNPWSFRGPYPVHRVVPILERAGWTVRVAHRDRQTSVRRQVESALDWGAGLVVGAGGDGTLRDIADVLVGRDVALGALPGGTANLWAHELGVARPPEQAAAALVDADVRRMDMGRIVHPDGRFLRFLLMAGVGIDGLMLDHTDPRLKVRLGVGGIAIGVLRAIPDFRPFPVEITVDGRPAWEGRVIQVIIGNSRLYANLVHATPDARVDDGSLDVTVVPAGDLEGAVRLGWSLVLRRRPGREVPRFRGREIAVRTPVVPPVEVDGSAVRSSSLRGADGRPYRMLVDPRALAVLVPRSYAGDLFRSPPGTAPVS
jgi:diacylglycerol kinase family enzyme